ncbi:hypothetical protein A2U01_0050046, partial [Trifolium medium]|nr:hypothetical protein [Trifolium medium]
VRRAEISVKKDALVNFLTTHGREDLLLDQQMLWCMDGYPKDMHVCTVLEFHHL